MYLHVQNAGFTQAGVVFICFWHKQTLGLTADVQALVLWSRCQIMVRFDGSAEQVTSERRQPVSLGLSLGAKL